MRSLGTDFISVAANFENALKPFFVFQKNSCDKMN